MHTTAASRSFDIGPPAGQSSFTQSPNQQSSSLLPAPVINPIGASSNYTKQSSTPVGSSNPPPHQAQGGLTAAPNSNTQSHSHNVTGSNVDLTSCGDAASAADEPGLESTTSCLDRPGLSDPQDNALPEYQVILLARVSYIWNVFCMRPSTAAQTQSYCSKLGNLLVLSLHR